LYSDGFFGIRPQIERSADYLRFSRTTKDGKPLALSFSYFKKGFSFQKYGTAFYVEIIRVAKRTPTVQPNPATIG